MWKYYRYSINNSSAYQARDRSGGGGPSPSAPDINKKFLTNTILSVESHNRREEVDSCWRIQKLENDMEENLRRGSKQGADNTITEDSRSREYWANLKVSPG